ncbi:hemolysin family protein [Geminicoccaceae bacterium 1502E]|nr:hemolysin family protein [Geminicoccaceae bacterium 1502E]
MPVAELLVVLGLVLLNGLFAMAELAVVSSRPVRLKQRAEAGGRGARVALRLREDPTSFLSTVQVGITLVGIFAGAYSGATFADPLAGVLRELPGMAEAAPVAALVLVVAGVTYLSLIVGELVPKRVALSHPEAIAGALAPLMALLARVAAPVVWLLRVSTEGMVRLLHVPAAPASQVSDEELRGLLKEGTEAGVFHPEERAIIDSVVRVADEPVRSIMTPRTDLVWLDVRDEPEALLRRMRESGHSRFLVGDGGLDRLLGVVQSKDLLGRLGHAGPVDLGAHLRQPIAVPESLPVVELLEHFRRASVHLAVVMDEHGGVEGIVTPTDLLIAIVGELPGAGSAEAPEAVRREDGSWLIDGRLPLHQAERLLETGDMGEGHDYATMAGFMLWKLGRLPREGEHFRWRDLRFEVVDMDGRRIDRILIEHRPEPEDETTG